MFKWKSRIHLSLNCQKKLLNFSLILLRAEDAKIRRNCAWPLGSCTCTEAAAQNCALQTVLLESCHDYPQFHTRSQIGAKTAVWKRCIIEGENKFKMKLNVHVGSTVKTLEIAARNFPETHRTSKQVQAFLRWCNWWQLDAGLLRGHYFHLFANSSSRVFGILRYNR